jgi:flagellar export protein FliJ
MLEKIFDFSFIRSVEALSRAAHAEAAAADTLDGLLMERQAAGSRGPDGATGAMLGLRELVARTLETRIDRMRAELAARRGETERCRRAVGEARARVRSAERLGGRRAEEAAREESMRERRELDEIAGRTRPG